MPLFFQHTIDTHTKLAIWKIEEEEAFFLAHVPLQRQITHPHKRLQHLAGRFLLKILFPDFPIELIRIADTRKPFLEDELFHFSISHCDVYAAVIVSRTQRVGIDIEVPNTKVERIKNKFLHPEELQAIAGREETQMQLLTLLWSSKEAVFKWWSYGNVDFSEMIRLQPFTLQPKGSFDGTFLEPHAVHQFVINYHVFPNLCLAWLVTDR